MNKTNHHPLAVAVLLATTLTGAMAGSESSAAEVRVLTGEQGTAQTGSWMPATGASMRLESRPGLYAIAGSGATYTMTPSLPETNDYTVQVFNNCYSPRAHNAKHVVHHADGIAVHSLEQDCALDAFVGQWRTLGTYRFEAGSVGRVVLDSSDSNNSYVGVTGVRFLYSPSGTNAAPTIMLPTTNLSVQAGEQVSLSATATDAEDGDITEDLIWTSSRGGGEGGSFHAIAGDSSFTVLATVEDSQGASANGRVDVSVVGGAPPAGRHFGFDSECDGAKNALIGFTTNNAAALPQVGADCGRYVADLLSNANDVTLHFNQSQGRFDGILADFPFTAVARGVGIAPVGQPTQAYSHPTDAYLFAGMQIHHVDLNNRNSAHVVVGQRGGSRNTIEGKQTRDGVSQQDDIGANMLPDGRADIRIVGTADRKLKVYWQPHMPGMPDAWIPYEAPRAGRQPGDLRGEVPDWGSTVYVGLITYAFGNAGVPFTGTIDSLEIVDN